MRKILKRWGRSFIKMIPGGKAILYRRALMKDLFEPCCSMLYSGHITPESIYQPAFDRIFFLLNAFYLNSLKGDIYEFGVWNGYSSKIIADRIKQFKLNSVKFHLFDSFEGLPEITKEDASIYECANQVWKKGQMSTVQGIESLLDKVLNRLLGEERVNVVKGFFHETLPKQKDLSPAILIHLDCDLYSSSKYVLETMIEYNLIQDGTILVCDDWMSSFGQHDLGQQKALKEIQEEYPQWLFEPHFNYGLGSQVFVIHENKSSNLNHSQSTPRNLGSRNSKIEVGAGLS